MEFIESLGNINIIIYMLKTFFISIFAYNTAFKSVNKKYGNIYKNIIAYIIIGIIAMICGEIKFLSNSFNDLIFLIISLSLLFSKITKEDFGYSILIGMISLCINYSAFIIATAISFIPSVIFNIENDYINLGIIVAIHSFLNFILFKIKRFKKGFLFLQEKLKNEYFNILILNISVIILFSIIILSNYNEMFTDRIGFGFIFFSIIMFITIQKSLQLYYKQKLVIQELNETKEELENKKQEIEQLEKENLNFSKTSHSIAHRQKALEYKLNQLMLKAEIAPEIDIEDKVNEIAKELQTQTEVELSKTNISEIDNMLKYMQSECIKNKIDFQLQLSGNIHHMVNKYVSKENLEILIADHIKNSIIAINHSENINKSILVRLGIIDGIYSLYVYDSGVEFEVDTLLKLGKMPSTTHSDDGGTGMGFMNTFDTLKKYKASMVIKEYGKPSKDNYTKLVIIKFDHKNEYKICSYRQKEIKQKDNNNKLIVEEISL
jgi:hypothetical protein